MSFEIVPAHDIPLSEQAGVFNDAFTGYLAGWTSMDAPAVARFLCAQGADLCYSRFVREKDGTLVAFGYINRTGNIPRVAGMGTVPAARRTGAAGYLISQLLDEAKARGDEAMVLEVFEQNLPAHTLYRRYGFREMTRLFGWRRGHEVQLASSQPDQIEECSILAASQTVSAIEYPNLPWQISRHAIAKLADTRAYRANNASIVIGNPESPPVRVHGLFSNAKNVDWESLRIALRSVLRLFPKREFFAPPIFPEEFGVEIFEPLSFSREPLNQFLMRRDL